MEIERSNIQARVTVTILRLKGDFDSHSAGEFNEVTRTMIESGADNLLLDFSEVPFMSSVGIRSLSAVYDWLHPQRSAEDQRSVAQAVHDGVYQAPHLKLLNPNTRVLKTLHLADLDRYFQIFNDEESALATF